MIEQAARASGPGGLASPNATAPPWGGLSLNASTLLEAAPDAMVIVDPEGRILLVNAQTEALFGYSRNDLLGQPVEVLVPERMRAQHPARRARYFAHPRVRGMGSGLDLYARRRDGSEFPVEISLSPLQTESGVIVSAAIRDITERKREQEKFRGLLEAAPDAMVIVDPDGRIVLVNSQTEALFGYSRNDLLGQPVEVLVPERMRAQHPARRIGYFAHPRVRGMGSGLDLYARRRDGSEFPVEISLSPLQTESGVIVSAAIRDITERKRAEDARGHLAAIVDSSDDAIISKTLDGVVTSWNAGAAKLFGYTAQEMTGESITKLIPGDRATEEAALLENLRQGSRVDHYETTRRRKDGSIVHVSVSISPIVSPSGHITGASKIARDITEQRRSAAELERYMRELQRSNEELDEFAYVASHDLKEPLRGIHNYAKFLAEDYSQKLDEQGAGYIDSIQRLARRLTSLVDQLLHYSRLGSVPLSLAPVDIDALLDEVLDDLRPFLMEAKVEIRRSQPLPRLCCDAVRVRELLQNLIANAARYNDKPERFIEIGCCDEAARPVIFVRDNGIGIAPQHQDKIFGIFQRLHARDEFSGGSGAGLTIVKRIVERHGGRIWLESRIGEGSTFYFTLSSDHDRDSKQDSSRARAAGD